MALRMEVSGASWEIWEDVGFFPKAIKSAQYRIWCQQLQVAPDKDVLGRNDTKSSGWARNNLVGHHLSSRLASQQSRIELKI